MTDYKKQLDEIQEEINNKKVQKAKLEERRENLLKETKQIKKDLEELGVSEDKLDEVVSALEIDIKEEIQKCQNSLN